MLGLKEKKAAPQKFQQTAPKCLYPLTLGDQTVGGWEQKWRHFWNLKSFRFLLPRWAWKKKQRSGKVGLLGRDSPLLYLS